LIALTAIRALLGRVPMLAWALAAALAWGAWQRHQVTVEHTGKLKAVQELADLRLAAAQTTVTVLTTTMAGQQEAVKDAHVQTEAADTARLAVTDALGRLLERNRAAGRGRAAAPAAAGSTPDAGACVQSDVLRSAGEEAGRYAAIADRARTEGAACVASYEAAERAMKAATP
jgi:hypothetical protein